MESGCGNQMLSINLDVLLDREDRIGFHPKYKGSYSHAGTTKLGWPPGKYRYDDISLACGELPQME